MSDLMGSAFATFLDQRKTKHHHHDNPAPPLLSSPSSYDVLHPPLHPPPFPKRQRRSLTVTDLLHENSPPTPNPFPPALQQEGTNLLTAKQPLRNSYFSNDKHRPISVLSSDKTPTNTYGIHSQKSAAYPRGPMIGGVPLLNSSHSSKEASRNLLSEQVQAALPRQVGNTSRSTALRTSSLSRHTLSLLNETTVQKPKSTTPRPFACRHEGCAASFIKQNHLSRHIRIVHNKERPYHCTIPGCGSRFGSKSHLGDHTRAVHMRIKLFKCEMCNASWSKRFNLKKHIRVRHLGEKPYRCQQCQLSFGTRSHATRHELKVHKRSFTGGLTDPKGNVCA